MIIVFDRLLFWLWAWRLLSRRGRGCRSRLPASHIGGTRWRQMWRLSTNRRCRRVPRQCEPSREGTQRRRTPNRLHGRGCNISGGVATSPRRYCTYAVGNIPQDQCQKSFGAPQRIAPEWDSLGVKSIPGSAYNCDRWLER